jgi:hypothetical protein
MNPFVRAKPVMQPVLSRHLASFIVDGRLFETTFFDVADGI